MTQLTIHPSSHHLFTVSSIIHHKIAISEVTKSQFNHKETITQTLHNHVRLTPFLS